MKILMLACIVNQDVSYKVPLIMKILVKSIVFPKMPTKYLHIPANNPCWELILTGYYPNAKEKRINK